MGTIMVPISLSPCGDDLSVSENDGYFHIHILHTILSLPVEIRVPVIIIYLIHLMCQMEKGDFVIWSFIFQYKITVSSFFLSLSAGQKTK